ncbi:hypothetical protein [Raoultibacter timonensis]|uniref:Uncharacterized protein n=1 Tax=Raoultibacter timonensis TaxID=1907662 RepID=A0ABN6MA94_9ACTN|nr:hypothetical protein [Raoultibacter timonensis]BDE94920.1 hypothetical protein CE91St30_02530 [Raoultibacter timonensis]BDF49523.1 hypothetical protein CE91St31_02530 [Raoultibacter timonensis]
MNEKTNREKFEEDFKQTLGTCTFAKVLGVSCTDNSCKSCNAEQIRKLASLYGVPEIDRVVFRKPATIVFWADGSPKTVVKKQPGDKWDEEKGVAMAIAKKMHDNKREYFDVIRNAIANAERQKPSKKPKKFDWDGFKRNEFVVNIRTEKDAVEFCNAVNAKRELQDVMRAHYFETYQEKTCYWCDCCYSDVDYVKRIGKRIVKFKHGKFVF